MIRVKDPERSLEFYRDVIGMKLIARFDFEEAKFSLYFLDAAANEPPADVTVEEVFSRPGLLELVHNWGSENDPGFRTSSGNEEPKGYGHICLSVPDIEAACAHLDANGVTFRKRLGEGGMKDIVFFEDPDGYWIELVAPGRMRALVGAHRVV
ncbi:lactoylglutathione lyase (plasmid) [Qingshengfaniella alkalisoli]|uniref:lactoylglutathione lyase n=2 Tax=Qingshengfaniella alkalisoli TaxID=2599296 RepID=A0A5B8J1M5_9RHOB|nr:lactoylglutathione lyase [Qingshengfaniella alkalisoli]